MPQATVEQLAAQAMRPEPTSAHDAAVLVGAAEANLEEMVYWAGKIRERHFGRRVSFCSIAAGRIGGCDQDCAWCGQSARHAQGHCSGGAQPAMDHARLLEAAKGASAAQASCFCVVNPGRRPTESDVRALETLNESLRSRQMPAACASLGELDETTARRLAQAGVRRYNHNLETSRSHFASLVSTHTYDDRLATLRQARRAGMTLCCGGIFGIGESWADRIELAITLRDHVGPDIVPLNFLDARPGTPLAHQPPLTPRQCLAIIAIFRFMLPTTNIKIAGGRRLLGQLQSWVFAAGASSIMVGDYLTTCGRDAATDLQMVRDLGLELAGEEAPPPVTAQPFTNMEP